MQIHSDNSSNNLDQLMQIHPGNCSNKLRQLTAKKCRLNEQRMASGHSQGGISILARTHSIARRENNPFSRGVCKTKNGAATMLLCS
jgi:hypothetical protein